MTVKVKIIAGLLCLVSLTVVVTAVMHTEKSSSAIASLTWEDLGKIKFSKEWDDRVKKDITVPVFSNKVQGLNGKDISITGYFIPMELNSKHCAISKTPNSSCFFCGNGGIETVMMVNFARTIMNFNDDEFITVRGKLKLDSSERSLIYNLNDAHYIRSN